MQLAMRRKRLTYRMLAERCARLGWDVPKNTLMQVAGGFRGISTPKAKIVAEALDYEVTPWELVSFKDSLKEHDAHAA